MTHNDIVAVITISPFVILLLAFLFCTFKGPRWVSNLFIKPSATARAIGDLLDRQPLNWSSDGHVLSHNESGVHLWIANQDYGLQWWKGDRHGYSMGISPPNRDKHHVFQALQRRKKLVEDERVDEVFRAAILSLTKPAKMEGEFDE